MVEEKGLVSKMLPYVPSIMAGSLGILGLTVTGLQINDIYKTVDFMSEALRNPNLVEQAKLFASWTKFGQGNIYISTLASIGFFTIAAHYFREAKTNIRDNSKVTKYED